MLLRKSQERDDAKNMIFGICNMNNFFFCNSLLWKKPPGIVYVALTSWTFNFLLDISIINYGLH